MINNLYEFHTKRLSFEYLIFKSFHSEHFCRITTFTAADKCWKVDGGKRGNKHLLTR